MLLERLKQGDKSSFNEIYARYSRSLYRFLYTRLRDAGQCEDIMQDVFVSLWEKRDSINITHTLKGYLYQAIRFKITDQYRHFERLARLQANLQTGEHYMASPEEVIDVKTRLKRTKLKIESLPEKMREVFILSRYEYLPVNRIADKLNIKPQTVKNQISKALEILRQQDRSFLSC